LALIVQSDFDDTITVGNVSTMVHKAFAPDLALWQAMEDEYHAGKYSVEESNIREFALIRRSRAEIEEYVRRNVVVREGFGEFVRYCEAENIKLVVVSSGLDLYIRPTLEKAGLARLGFRSGNAEVTPKGIVVSYTDPQGRPLTKGFKDAYLRLHKRQGHTIFYLGDGHSDYGPAEESDFVMARSTLRKWMESNGLPHTPFEDFHQALRSLQAFRRKLGA